MRLRNIYFIVLILVSCNDREKKSDQSTSAIGYKPDSIALKLNNKASRLIGHAGHTYDSLKTKLYDSAIFYLNQAIKIDSLYLLAFMNKAQALQRKGSLQEALEVLNKVEVIKPDFVEVIMGQGFILEKLGKKKLADNKYGQTLKAYEKRLVHNPDNTKIESDIAFLYLFLEDKNKAIDEIQNLILENPNNDELTSMERYIENFDRAKFIKEY